MPSTLGSTLITDKYTNTIDANGNLVEVWQVASGGNAGDTCTITPNKGRFVISADGGPAYTDIATGGTATNVQFTIVAGTSSIGAFNVRLVTKQ